MKRPTLSIIMPALNEELCIREAVESSLAGMKKHGIEGEVIVVNDGSSDRTKGIVEEIMKETSAVRIVNHDRPRGIGRSFCDGVKASKNDAVVYFPGDNENDPDDALSFYALLEHVDLIVPFIHNVEVRDRIRRMISSLYRFIINMSFGINVNYTNGTVFFRRCILEDIELKSTGFFYQAEILIRLIRKGYLYAEVPNFLAVRTDGKSKAITLKSLRSVMLEYVRLSYAVHVQRIESNPDERRLHPASVSYAKIQRIKSGP